MSNFKGGRRGFRGNNNNKHNNKTNNDITNETNPTIIAFKNYAKELDDKHDRYERIIKYGRDITIESKRIIFLLHTIDPKKNNSEKVLADAEKRLQTLCDVNFLSIAKELGDLDPYQYSRAYSPGLQEFIEAYSFYEYLNQSKLSDWNVIQKKLNYSLKIDNVDEKIENEDDKAEPVKDGIIKNYTCLVQPNEYMLGLGDLSGEIMRRCINSLGSGDIDTCFQCCKTMQSLFSGYLGISAVRNRELSRKIYTLRQSVLKTENVCYNVKVRGGEAAKWGAVEPYGNTEKGNFEEDEGFY